MRFAVSLAIVALLAGPASARVIVDHDADTDFENYRTYAWNPGTDAARPQVQEWVVRAVERELEIRGMRKAMGGRADLYVVTRAFAEMDSQVRGNYLQLHDYAVGVITSDVILTTVGVLSVDLVDGGTERPVWRGMASEVMGEANLEKVRKKIDKVVKKMFKKFPPR